MEKVYLHRPNGAPIELTEPVLLGWSSDCAVQLPQDPSVAWRHALIRPNRDGFAVIALSRHKPLYLNEKLVPTRQQLANGDTIRCGRFICTFEQIVTIDNPPCYLTRLDNGTRYFLKDDVTLIGRNPECHIQITVDETVSRHHAQIERVNDVYTLVDLDSYNATYLNGIKVIQAQRLNKGDVIRFGVAAFEFFQAVAQLPMVVSGSTEVQRYGRITYSDRMHLNEPYPLEVSLLLAKTDVEEEGQNVLWTTMLVRQTERTPTLEVCVTSSCCFISPNTQSLRITPRTNAQCTFEVKPYKVVSPAEAEIKVQIFYKGECIKTVYLPIEVYDYLKVGPLSLPNKTHGGLVLISTIIGLLAAGLDMVGADEGRWRAVLFLTLIVLVTLIIIGLIINYRLTRKTRTIAQGV